MSAEDGTTSYAALEARTARMAGGLAAAGIRPGDRVALLIGNRPAFVEALLACQRIGAVTVPLNPRQRAPEIAFALNQCGAAGIVFEYELAPNLPDKAEIPTVDVSRMWSLGAPHGDLPRFEALAEAPAVDPVAVDEDATAILLYTSGTTGRPKGAMLTHLNIVHSALHFAHVDGVSRRRPQPAGRARQPCHRTDRQHRDRARPRRRHRHPARLQGSRLPER